MPVNNLKFGDDVEAWVQRTTQRMEAVFRESTKRVVDIAQSHIPVDTGFARASIRGSLESMPQVDPANDRPGSGPFSYDSNEINVVIAEAKLGSTIYIGWTASYVVYLEYGHSKQAPSGFVRLAALQWEGIVHAVQDELRQQVGQ